MAKYTAEQIKKALKCCEGCSLTEDCNECPYVECSTITGCVNEMIADTLDLINRQEAEIERLGKLADVMKISELETLAERLGDDVDRKLKYIYELEEKLQTAKSEAIKEFVERINEILCLQIGPSRRLFWKIKADIDNLVKEMAGEGE